MPDPDVGSYYYRRPQDDQATARFETHHYRFLDDGLADGVARYVERKLVGGEVVDDGPVKIARHRSGLSWEFTQELAEEEEAVKIIQLDKFGQLVDVFHRHKDDPKMCDIVSGVLDRIESDDGAPVLVLHQTHPEEKVIVIPTAEIVRVARA